MIIDFHAHIFPDRIAAATVSALSSGGGIPACSDGTLAGLLTQMDEAGVDIAVNLPVLTRPSQFESILSFAERINSSEELGGRIISFAGIHPCEEKPEERLNTLAERGIKGIKIHPDYQEAFIDDERYIRILRCAKDLGLITVTHAGVDGAYIGKPVRCTPERALRLLDRLGGYDRLVLAHLGANEMFDEVYDSLAGADVYLDTAYILHVATREQLLRIFDRHSTDRILFATDSPWRTLSDEVEIIRSLGLGKDIEEKILGTNALRLLGL
ncbi:MAG: amidohydrolase family protein [Clostridia bacterium]|nr:amidohydrolase family protein [Clostridia bacterium]